MDVDTFYAGLALDEATPVKLALAPLPDRRLLRVVSSTAAKEITAVHAGRRPIAKSALRACVQNDFFTCILT